MAKGPTPATCDAVDERDGHSCVRCGASLYGVAGSRHHRKLRRFGDHSAANLILLCGSGTTGCHGWVHAHPAASYEVGWMLHGWQDPEQEPVAVWNGRQHVMALLDREGNRLTP